MLDEELQIQLEAHRWTFFQCCITVHNTRWKHSKPHIDFTQAGHVGILRAAQVYFETSLFI